MFGRRSAYEALNDNKKRKEEKEQITHQFHRSLKSLQQKEHIDGATIVSNEASNSLCSVLEAVFLHGVKDNMMSKLVSYAHGASMEVKLNFWGVVKKFTHKDVIVQLKELTQITCDVGLSRAWVRLAINDGLMASYLASMKADNKSMQYFYHPWAYLLDFEQPDILYNHLTGLMGLNFHLSLNSSILNTWSSTTIALAGLAANTPPLHPVIQPGTPSPPASRTHSQSSLTSADNDATTTTTTTSTAIFTSCPNWAGVVSTPPNTPADPSFFTHVHDADILKRFGTGFLSSSVSSGSSGQASCPDPGDPSSTRSSRSNSPRSSPYQSLRYMSRQDRKMDEEMKLKALLQHLDQKELEREQQDKERIEKEQQDKERIEKETHKRQKEAATDEVKTQLEEEQRRRCKMENTKKVTKVASESPLIKNTPPPNPNSAQHENGETQLEEEKTQGRKEGEEKSELWLSSKSFEEERRKRIEGLTPDGSRLEECIAEAAAVAEAESLYREQSDHVDFSSTNLASQEGRVEEEEGEKENWQERPQSSLGNSLNAMDGWTSTYPYYHPQQHLHHDGLEQSAFEQSYETMLKGYRAGQGRDSGIIPVTTVLDNLPVTTAIRPGQGPTARNDPSEPFTAVDMIWPVSWQSDEEFDFTDYEIISTPEETSDTVKLEQMRMLSKPQGKNSQSNKCATPSCDMGVGFFHGPGQVCNFDGRTYCEQCHLSQTAYIPAEIVFNWNFKKKKVCAESYKFLLKVQDQPLLDLDELSPGIYSTVPQLYSIMQLRLQLTSLRSYMFMCSESTATQLKDRVWPREYLYDNVHLYSVNDLVEVRAGRLEVFLKETVDICQRHVACCTLCQAKGFYCELCQDPSPIFPFQTSTTVKCKNCKNVYHSRCKTDAIACPKCVRYTQRGIRRQTGDDDDYAYSPDL